MSCSSFLKEEPKGQWVAENFKTIEDVEVFMPTIFYYVSEFYWDGCSFNMSLRGDDMTGTHSGSVQLERFNQPDDEQYVLDHWYKVYRAIKHCNSFLNAVGNVTGDQKYIDNLTGVAYFFRGWMYFNIARFYRQAPIVYEVGGGTVDIKSSSQEKVFEQAVADLIKAEELLPDNWNGNKMEKEAPFKLTAKAALAEVYLNMAGYPLKKGTEYYQKAADKAKEVIDGAPAQGRGFDTYDNMWNEEDPISNENKERLFCIYFGVGASQRQSVTRCFYPAVYGGYGWIAAERTFFEEFPEGPRKEATFWDTITAKVPGMDQPMTVSYDDPLLAQYGIPNQPLYRKRNLNKEDKGLDRFTLKGGQRTSLMMPIRYSLTATTYAEAITRATGHATAEARKLMDQIRDRAGLAHYDAGLDGEAFANAVFQERAWEFAAEWVRYPDLCRMEQVENVFAKRSAKEFNPNSGLGTPSHEYYFLPVPADEARLNPNLLQVME